VPKRRLATHQHHVISSPPRCICSRSNRLLFPNEEWSNTATDLQLDSEVARLRVCIVSPKRECRTDDHEQPNVSFAESLEGNIQALSTQNGYHDSTISGFLYVPDLDRTHHCFNISKQYVPNNVTRQANLPATDFTLIAIAPWISSECAQAYLGSAHMDPARAFIFYLLDNGNTKPPPASSPVWDLPDGRPWMNKYEYPVYAVPGLYGSRMVSKLSLYSGNMTSVPFGHEISELPGVDPRDYVRLYTDISMANSSLPSIWVFLLIVFAALAFMLGFISIIMNLIQQRRRHSLRRRVASGEVNLEALGIKRLTVPQEYLDRLPLFIYNDGSEASVPTSPEVKKINAATAKERHSSKETTNTVDSSYSGTTGSTWLQPQLVIIDESMSGPESLFYHKFLPYSQPTCPICLEDFESGVTEIRELMCGHIFHPECIDTFLGNNSSLCPMCKKSALPVGYCPTKITNAMVRRERNIRRLRSRVIIREENGNLETNERWGSFRNLGSRIRRAIFSTGQTEPQTLNTLPLQQQQPVFAPIAIPPRPPPAVLASHTPRSQDSVLTRQALVEQRIRELAAGQAPIRDPDLVDERQRPKCMYIVSSQLNSTDRMNRAAYNLKSISWFLIMI
jgi:hypothetical protein